MKPEDIVWRTVDRLQESKHMLNEMIDGLDPEKDKMVLDALIEIEQLTSAQVNICRRLQRRLGD